MTRMRLSGRLNRMFAIYAILLGIATGPSLARSDDRPLKDGERAAVVDSLAKQLSDNYVLPDVAERMAQLVRDRLGNGEYEKLASCQEFAEELTRNLRDLSRDLHLEVQFHAEGIPYDSEAPVDPQEVERFRENGRRRNYEFRKVERLDGGVGLLQVDGFYPAAWIADTAAGAMAFLENSECVILDLRWNGGGQSGGTLLASYFFKEETHLSDFYDRPQDATHETWTYPVRRAEQFAEKDLYILTSNRTFSAPEALAYDLQALKRATIVGEATGGGAHGTTIFRLTDHFSAGIPFCRSINPITRSNWEGIGVQPDVVVPADQALLTAHLIALRKALEKHSGDSQRAAEFVKTIAEKESELEALKTPK